MGRDPLQTILLSRTISNMTRQPKRWLRVHSFLTNRKESTRGKVWVSRRVWLGNTRTPRIMWTDTSDSAKAISCNDYSKTGMGETMKTSKGRYLVINVWFSFWTLQIRGSITNHLPLPCPQNNPFTTYINWDRSLVAQTIVNAWKDVWLLFGHKASLYSADGSGLELLKQNYIRWKNVG